MIIVNNLISSRKLFFIGALFCLILLLTAIWFQFQQGLEPCPLCISQRLAILLTGLIMLVAGLHAPNKHGIIAYSITAGISALLGASISTRHVWLQHLPPEEVPACGPGLSYMLENFPIGDTLTAMLSGTGDCAKVDWTFLGFSMPVWVLLCFLSLALLNLLILKNAA